MKTILNFIKSNGLSTIFIIVLFGLFFIAINSIGTCTDKRTQKRIEQQQIQNTIQAAIDSTKLAPLKQAIKAKDDSIFKLKQEIIKAKNNSDLHLVLVEKLKAKATKLEADYNKLKNIPNADKLIAGQKKIIVEQDSVIESIGAEAESYSDLAYMYQKKCELQTAIINSDSITIKSLYSKLNTSHQQTEKVLKQKKTAVLFRNIIIVVETAAIIVMSLR